MNVFLRTTLTAGAISIAAALAFLPSVAAQNGTPRFSLPDADILSLVAFTHSQQDKAMSQTGVRKGVEDSDLTTGNAAAGKQYFEGKGGCVACHSATGDLKGVATKYTGLRLE